MTPQTILTKPDGFKRPNDVCIPNTNVAESADVIKNEPTKIIAINDKIVPIGVSLKIPNNCVSGGILKICLDCLPISIPVIPKAVNHSILIIVGTPNTAITNSRIERPFEIRAMKIPTNGDQLIHQPQ